MNKLSTALHLLGFMIIYFGTCPGSPAYAGAYLESAHGDTDHGVNRGSAESENFARGNCGHCHEQHAAGLSGGPYNFSLFYDNYVSLGPPPDGICFKCHDGSAGEQTTAVNNYSYSYRAGAWTSGGTPSNLAGFFDSGQVASFHDLDDISTFIQGQWGYTADSNPCVACHNPHAATGDPEYSPSTKDSGTRGWLLSRPGQHNDNPWPLWGNDSGEKMYSAYPSKYQAPLRFTANYEPDGTTTQDGSNLTDFVTFCSDCHNHPTINITTPTFSKTLTKIVWANEQHGGTVTTGSLCGDAPYNSSTDKVLSCMDCHESHGSANAYILRPEVNGAALANILAAGSPGTGSTTTWSTLCNSCHQDDKELVGGGCTSSDTWFIVHHDQAAVACSADAPYNNPTGSCTGSGCHTAGSTGGTASCLDSTKNGGTVVQGNCDECHYHGSTF